MKKLICCCGHDCSRCLTYLATINNDEKMRKQAQMFYKTEMGIDIPIKDIHCLGGCSKDVFCLCQECPFIKCCDEHNVEICSDCPGFPCELIKSYQENYVNKCNQIKYEE